MRRPLIKWFLAASGGLIAAYYLPGDKFLIFFSALIMVIVSILIIAVKSVSKTHCLVLVLIFLSFFSYLQLERLTWQQAKMKEILGERTKLSGIIKQVSVVGDDSDYFISRVKNLETGAEYDFKIKLRVWESEEELEPGDKIQFVSRLELATPKKNPGGFSYRNYLQKREVYALGDIKYNKITKLSGTQNPFVKSINWLRAKIKLAIKENFKGENKALVKTLLLGTKDNLSSEVSSSFDQLGISHLLVISGFHIGLISCLIYLVINYLKLSLKVNLIVNALFLIFYLAIINWQLSALRAALLIILALWGQILDRRVDLYNILAGIALLFLIINPWSLFKISFQLSFTAVAAISYLTPILKRYFSFVPKKIREIITATLAVQIALGPILIYYFNQLSVISIVANLLLMPLISLVLILIFIFLVINLFPFYITEIIVVIINSLLYLSMGLANLLADNFTLNISLATPSLIIIFAYYMIIYAIIKFIEPVRIPYSKQNRKKVIILLLSIVIVVTALGFGQNEELELIFFAVGLGDGIYLKTPRGRNILIDGGATGKEMISFLKTRGINRLDLIFISHLHNDHGGGIIEILKEFEVAQICYPPTEDNWLKAKLHKTITESKVKILTKGDKVTVNEVEFLVLHPERRFIEKGKLNNNSLVLRMRYEDFSLLLTGDMEKKAEKNLVRSKAKLESDVLKVGHHGSKTSSTESFLKRVVPELSIMSVGKNKHGLPNREVENRLRELGIKNLRTDKEGAVIIKTDGRAYQYQTFLD
ncbi:MAG: DNA internalization-related competence protein ComEC/Rec2 [Halanaerobacter sp.]